MRKLHNNNGFSLTEVLLAVGTLAIGMIFIAGVFPAGILFTTIATERTIAAVVADEAFAKIRLYADPNEYDDIGDINLSSLTTNWLTNFTDALPPAVPPAVNIDPNEFTYPSDPNMAISQKQYFWSALCRLAEGAYGPTYPASRLVQVTVFVSRKTGAGRKYRDPDNPINSVLYPMPVKVGIVSATIGSVTLQIEPGKEAFINDGYTIVDDKTGRMYRVLERDADQPDELVLDRPWVGGTLPGSVWVWVVPPPVGGGRYPCIAIYQKVIRF